MSRQTVSSRQQEAPEAGLKEVQLKQVRSLLSAYRELLEDSKEGKGVFRRKCVSVLSAAVALTYFHEHRFMQAHTRAHATRLLFLSDFNPGSDINTPQSHCMKISFKIFTYRHTFQKHVLSYSGAVG
jgi:hypothetical protein